MNTKYFYICACFICWFFLGTSCTKDQFIKTGLSNGKFDGTLLEYMEAHSYDWDSTVLMVRHAGPEMVRIFEGKDPQYPEITFFGVTNHSIRRYMLKEDKKTGKKRFHKVTEMDPEWCKNTLLRYLVKGKIYRNDVPQGEVGQAGVVVGNGGAFYTTLAGSTIWMRSQTEAYHGVANMGPKYIYIAAVEAQRVDDIASADLEPNHCVVHSLAYQHTLGDFNEK